MEPRNALTLSRRHTTGCHHDWKTPEPRTKEERKADDCLCNIVADGFLSLEPERIRTLALRTNDWAEANRQKAAMLARGRVTAPPVGLAPGQHTIEHAIKRFFESRGPTSMAPFDKATQGKYEVLLNTRLKQFCGKLGIDRIDAFDQPGLALKFQLSWVNLNPHRNKKGMETVIKPLAHSTKVTELERFRAFLEFCRSEEMITKNRAKDIKLTYQKPKPKYGLELDEYARLLEAAKQWASRTHARRDPREIVAEIELLRSTGIRVSDVINFPTTRIQRGHSGTGYRVVMDGVLELDQTVKTGASADIPIPDHVAELILSLPIKGERDGRKYWFWKCDGDQATATTNLKDDITEIIKLAQKEKKFRHHCTPHSLRHTFAIHHLNNGVDIRQVQRWLTHTSLKTTEDSYSHAIHSSNLIAQKTAEESWAKQLNM
jgi:site-specific recombinase XerD